MKSGSFIWRLWFVLNQTFECLSARAESATTPQRQGCFIYAAQLRKEENTEWHNRASTRPWVYGGSRSGFDTRPTKRLLPSHYGCGSTPTAAHCCRCRCRRRWLTDSLTRVYKPPVCVLWSGRNHNRPQLQQIKVNCSHTKKGKCFLEKFCFVFFFYKWLKSKLNCLWSWRRLRMRGGWLT